MGKLDFMGWWVYCVDRKRLVVSWYRDRGCGSVGVGGRKKHTDTEPSAASMSSCPGVNDASMVERPERSQEEKG